MIPKGWCTGPLTLITATYVCLDIPNEIRPPVTGQPDLVGGCVGSKVPPGRPRMQGPHDLFPFLLL